MHEAKQFQLGLKRSHYWPGDRALLDSRGAPTRYTMSSLARVSPSRPFESQLWPTYVRKDGETISFAYFEANTRRRAESIALQDLTVGTTRTGTTGAPIFRAEIAIREHEAANMPREDMSPPEDPGFSFQVAKEMAYSEALRYLQRAVPEINELITKLTNKRTPHTRSGKLNRANELADYQTHKERLESELRGIVNSEGWDITNWVSTWKPLDFSGEPTRLSYHIEGRINSGEEAGQFLILDSNNAHQDPTMRFQTAQIISSNGTKSNFIDTEAEAIHQKYKDEIEACGRVFERGLRIKEISDEQSGIRPSKGLKLTMPDGTTLRLRP